VYGAYGGVPDPTRTPWQTRAMKHDAHGYWLEEAPRIDPCPQLVGERSADVVVVGGGYTGMWTAWHLKQLEPEARVVLLEADRCGYGPSGRNGGFCNVMWFSLPNMRRRWGDDQALAVARAASEAVTGIESFCREEGVDAWFRRSGYLQVSTAEAHDGKWKAALEACDDLGADDAIQPLTPAQVGERCASPAFRGGAFYLDAATVQPARLAFGLRERLQGRGVEICEGSAMTNLVASPYNVEAHTSGGVVRAGAAVLAIGAAAKAPRGPLRGRLTVASSHIVLTEPVPELLEQIGWTGGECITDSRALIDYFRTTPDGRIAFGWGGGRIAMGARLGGRTELDADVVAQATAHLREYFPGLEGRSLTHAWGGPIDASPTHLPLVMPLHGGRAFAAAGYTGNGVGPSHMVARTLASLALDRRDAPSRLPFVDPSPPRVPPEPFHWLGGEAIRAGIERKEAAELAGRDPDPVSTLLSRVPELIGFHIGR
jgi:glycine/D-amino acid oxidase-like deaminating enzyme